ncbi:MAG: hypothetical protein GY811_30600 [Myxococcales bacterium]|nr:hypothetical protein [Myxococcales bacterium]
MKRTGLDRPEPSPQLRSTAIDTNHESENGFVGLSCQGKGMLEVEYRLGTAPLANQRIAEIGCGIAFHQSIVYTPAALSHVAQFLLCKNEVA